MKVLAISSEGDPLFIRDERGHDFEVEVRWATDARHRRWAKDEESHWDSVWESVYCRSPGSGLMLPPLPEVRFVVESALVKPAICVLTASYLPPLEEREVHERRTRAVERLGGSVQDDAVALRRRETHRREWNRLHPKVRSLHSSVIYLRLSRMGFETLDVAHARRAEAMRRLQDPPLDTADLIRTIWHGALRGG